MGAIEKLDNEELRNQASDYFTLRPEGYPKIDITFDHFCSQLKLCFINPITWNRSEMEEHYATYKKHQYMTDIKWVTKHGYQNVKAWAKEFFQQWTIEETGNRLKKKISIK